MINPFTSSPVLFAPMDSTRIPIQACLPGKPSVTKENSHSLRWD